LEKIIKATVFIFKPSLNIHLKFKKIKATSKYINKNEKEKTGILYSRG